MDIGQHPENHTHCPRCSGRKQKGMPTCMLHVVVRRFCPKAPHHTESRFTDLEKHTHGYTHRCEKLSSHISCFRLNSRPKMNPSDPVRYEPPIFRYRELDASGWHPRHRQDQRSHCLQIILPIFLSQVGYHKHKPCSAGTQCGQCPCGDESSILDLLFL